MALSLILSTFVLSTSAFAGTPPGSPDLDKLQSQFAATTKELVKNMRLASAYAPQCSFFGSAIANALAAPIQAIPSGAAKVDSTLNGFKTSVAAIGVAPSEGVDISAGAAQAVKAKQKEILSAAATPASVIDGMAPVVNDGVQKVQQGYSKAMGLLSGDSAPCRAGAAAFQKVYDGSLAADAQLKGIRSALDARKAALLRWNSGVQATLGANE